MGGGEHGVCGRHTCVLVRFGRWQGVYQVTKGVAFPLPPCDHVRGVPDHGETVAARSIDTRRRGPAQEKGTKGPASPPGWRARVLGCTLARERRARVVTRANANASTNSTARRRERERHGAAHDGEKNRLSQNASAH
jgi:hypothetical protein